MEPVKNQWIQLSKKYGLVIMCAFLIAAFGNKLYGEEISEEKENEKSFFSQSFLYPVYMVKSTMNSEEHLQFRLTYNSDFSNGSEWQVVNDADLLIREMNAVTPNENRKGTMAIPSPGQDLFFFPQGKNSNPAPIPLRVVIMNF